MSKVVKGMMRRTLLITVVIATLAACGTQAVTHTAAAPAPMQTDPNGKTCKTLSVIGNDEGYCPGDTPFTVSHADQLACRTVYRLVHLAQISPVAITDQQASEALMQSAIGTTKTLNTDLVVTADEVQQVGNSTTILAPLVSQCTAMGITAKNAENVS